MKREPGESYLDYWVTDAPAYDFVPDHSHVLRFMRDGDLHTVELFWDVGWTFVGWYVNLQAPLVIRADKFDTTDWALDLWVEPTGDWRWKDEDDFARAQELAVRDAASAAAVRAEAERVVAARPRPTGWEDWRPPVLRSGSDVMIWRAKSKPGKDAGRPDSGVLSGQPRTPNGAALLTATGARDFRNGAPDTWEPLPLPHDWDAF